MSDTIQVTDGNTSFPIDRELIERLDDTYKDKPTFFYAEEDDEDDED